MTSLTHRAPTSQGLLTAAPLLERSSSATLAIIGTAMAYAAAPVLARRLTDAGMAAVGIAFIRFALVAVVLGRFIDLRPASRRATTWGLTSGAMMGLGWIAHVHVIAGGELATAAVVYMIHPMVAIACSAVALRRWPAPRAVLAGAMVLLAGAIGIGVTPWSASGGAWSPVALIAPATMGFAIAVLTDRMAGLRPRSRLASVAVGASVVLLPGVVAAGLGDPSRVVPQGLAIVWAAGIAVGCALIPMMVYASAAPGLGAPRAAVAGATELPFTFLLAATTIGEMPGAGHLVAAALILVAVGVASPPRRSQSLSRGSQSLPRGSQSMGGLATTRSPAGP